MNIEILEKDNDQITFIVDDVAASFVNALRRILISEVPVMAIEEVWITENSSIVYDKIMSHRLGLIPLKTDLESFNLPNECECEGIGCPQCRVSFSLSKEALTEDIYVYSGDLEPDDPKVVPVTDNIPIIKLNKGQKVEFEAYAILGVGKDHAKWQSSTTTSYKVVPIIEIEEKRCTNCDQCVNTCPQNIFIKKDKKIAVQNVFNCSICKECLKACEDDAINLSWHENKFIFTVESTGAIAPEELVIHALKILNKKVKNFLEEIKNIIV